MYNTNTNTNRGVRQRTRSSTRGRRVLQPLPWLASTTPTHAWRSHAQLDKLQTTRCTHAGAFQQFSHPIFIGARFVLSLFLFTHK